MVEPDASQMDWILASASPRRQDLLKQILPDFRVVVADVEEWEPKIANPAEMVLENALMKARKVAEKYPESVVIAADTTVSLGKRIFSKPIDLEDAARILKQLSGRRHLVSTGVVVTRGGVENSFVETSRVAFKKLDETTIARYVSQVDVLDKAGGYGIQSCGEMIIDSWTGSLDNIMGLPIERLKRLLIQRKELIV